MKNLHIVIISDEAQSQKHISNILWNPCHPDPRLSGEQIDVLPINSLASIISELLVLLWQ